MNKFENKFEDDKNKKEDLNFDLQLKRKELQYHIGDSEVFIIKAQKSNKVILFIPGQKFVKVYSKKWFEKMYVEESLLKNRNISVTTIDMPLMDDTYLSIAPSEDEDATKYSFGIFVYEEKGDEGWEVKIDKIMVNTKVKEDDRYFVRPEENNYYQKEYIEIPNAKNVPEVRTTFPEEFPDKDKQPEPEMER